MRNKKTNSKGAGIRNSFRYSFMLLASIVVIMFAYFALAGIFDAVYSVFENSPLWQGERRKNE